MARRVNTHPTLDIEHVNRWNARIGPNRRKKPKSASGKPKEGPPKARKEEPIDPEDDFMIETDPADKPIDEATIDDAMDVIIETDADEWVEQIDAEPIEVISTAEVLDAIYDSDDPGESFTEYFKQAEEEVKRIGLPRTFTRDMLYEIGMKTDVDYEIDSHTKRAVFMDNYLNELVVNAYIVQQEMAEEDPSEVMDRNTLIKIVVNAYNEATSHNSNYEYYHSLFLDMYGIEEEYSDKGNPVGDFKYFEAAFKKTYKRGYKNHVGTAPRYEVGYDTMEEMLSHWMPTELEYRRERADATRRQNNMRKRVKRQYEKMMPEIANDDTLSSKEKFTLMDSCYRAKHGYSLYDDMWMDEMVDDF